MVSGEYVMNIQKTMKIFNEVKRLVLKKFDMNFVTIAVCQAVEEESEISKHYAKSFCCDFESICIAPGIETLPDDEIKAIFWREFGRLIAGQKADDAKSEKTIERYYGVKVSDFTAKPTANGHRARLKIA